MYGLWQQSIQEASQDEKVDEHARKTFRNLYTLSALSNLPKGKDRFVDYMYCQYKPRGTDKDYASYLWHLIDDIFQEKLKNLKKEDTEMLKEPKNKENEASVHANF